MKVSHGALAVQYSASARNALVVIVEGSNRFDLVEPVR